MNGLRSSAVGPPSCSLLLITVERYREARSFAVRVATPITPTSGWLATSGVTPCRFQVGRGESSDDIPDCYSVANEECSIGTCTKVMFGAVTPGVTQFDHRGDANPESTQGPDGQWVDGRWVA